MGEGRRRDERHKQADVSSLERNSGVLGRTWDLPITAEWVFC